MKQNLKDVKEDKKLVYLDSIDYESKNTGLNHFIIPDTHSFISFKRLIEYAISLIPDDAYVAFAAVHGYTAKEVKKDYTVRLKQEYADGFVEYFKFG